MIVIKSRKNYGVRAKQLRSRRRRDFVTGFLVGLPICAVIAFIVFGGIYL